MATSAQYAYHHLYRGGLIFLACLLLVTRVAVAEEVGILLLASGNTDLYRNFVSAYRNALPAIPSLKVSEWYQDDIPFTRADLGSNVRLVVTIGTRAASLAADTVTGLPVLNALIPSSSFHALGGEQADCSQHSAVFIDQPVQRRVLLAHLLYPDAHRYGILLGPTSSRRLPEIRALRLPDGVRIQSLVLTQDPGTAPETLSLIRNSDLLLAINDPLVLNRESAKWLLYETYQRQIPVIGFSHAYVHAGAAAAVFTDPEQVAVQTANVTRQWLQSGRKCLPAPQFSRDFRIAINHSVNDSLGGKYLTEKDLVDAIRARETAP